jgi:lipopolysaccharide export system protein LptC
MKGLPAIWFALIVLALLAALTLWIDHTVQPPAPKRDGSARHDPDYTVINFSSSRFDPFGNPRYGLSGAELRHYPDNDTTEIDRPFFTQYSLKKPTIQAQGERGLLSPNGENVYFMDNVKVVRAATPQKGELTILTEYLHIIPEQGILKTDQPVTILQAPRTVVHATGMEANKKERTLILFSRVKVHYERPGAPPSPPLKLEQLAGTKATSASPVQSGKNQGKQITKIQGTRSDQAKAGKAKVGTAKNGNTKAKKPETKTGQSKTRVRRHYENTTN